ncbi:MAG: hypothetical protein QOF21_1971 [Actinomycetota bacterium]|jgi:polyisoprenoid-binding protein YceI
MTATELTDHLTDGDWAGDWVLDPTRSAVHIRATSMWGLVKVAGRFDGLRGEGSLDREGVATGRLTIDTSSINTGNGRRDKHLRSDDFLHAATHGEITFTVDEIAPAGPDQVRVTGELTVVDHTHPLELTATLDDVDATGATVSTDVELDGSAWGIDSKMGAISKTTRVEARLRFTRTPS